MPIGCGMPMEATLIPTAGAGAPVDLPWNPRLADADCDMPGMENCVAPAYRPMPAEAMSSGTRTPLSRQSRSCVKT